MEELKNKWREAFDLRFVLQLLTMAVVVGVAWGTIKTDLTHITDEIQAIKEDRISAWSKQELVNEKAETGLKSCEDKHFETMKKLDILIVELQNGKYCKK